MFRICAIFAKARHRQSDTVPKHESSGWQGGKFAAKAAVEYVLIKKGHIQRPPCCALVLLFNFHLKPPFKIILTLYLLLCGLSKHVIIMFCITVVESAAVPHADTLITSTYYCKTSHGQN